jgi:hypothetical protein
MCVNSMYVHMSMLFNGIFFLFRTCGNTVLLWVGGGGGGREKGWVKMKRKYEKRRTHTGRGLGRGCHSEPEFENVYGARESIPRIRFRGAGNQFQ